MARPGRRAARALDRTRRIKADKKGTRLFAWVGAGVVKGKPGHVDARVLIVGGKTVSTSKFSVVK